MKYKRFIILKAMLLWSNIAFSQMIPVEVFTGHKKSTIDIMFFKFFKNKEGQNSKFLFFNRNRASIDYAMTPSINLPQFGFTEAFSYNHPKLKGFAPVTVVSVLNRGISPKVGIQFAKITKNYTVFSWVVSETLKKPTIDYFFLGRYTPKLTKSLNLFSQIELINAFPTIQKNNFSFAQRFRLGLKHSALQYGFGLDLSQGGRKDFVQTTNIGVFLRNEF